MNNHEEEREKILKVPLPVTLQECIDQRLVFHTSSVLEQYRRLKMHEGTLFRLEEKLKERERLFKKLGITEITIHSINLYPVWEDQEEPAVRMSFEFTFHGKLIRYIMFLSPEREIIELRDGAILTDEQEVELKKVLQILIDNKMELYNNFN